METRETLEIHLTVRSKPGSSEKLMQWCAANQLKIVDIELERGLFRYQPMITWRRFCSLEDLHTRIEAATRSLASLGCEVIRCKIECDSISSLAPRDESQFEPDRFGKYFEHHVKLLLPIDFALSALTRLAIEHQSHLSKNARRVRADGKCERFITQRCHDSGQKTAGARLNALIKSLEAGGYRIIEVEREYVLWDNHLELDDGWLTE